MDRKKIPEAENRLVILYALTRLGPCTSMQLLQFMMEYDLMNYFTMQLALCEMEEQGQLKQHAHPIGSLLTVTGDGSYTVGAFDHRIPASRRELIDREAPAWHRRFRLEQQTPAELVEIPGGQCVHLQLLEGDAPLLDILLRVPRGDSATVFLQRRWREAAQDVLETVNQMLSDGFSYDQTIPMLPPSANLQPTGDGSFLLSLRCANEDSLSISLPDEPLACWYAYRWSSRNAELMTTILRLLHLSLNENE